MDTDAQDLEALEDADFADAEHQLRVYGLGHIEHRDEAWWFDLLYVLRQYHDEHLSYPTRQEFDSLWRQENEAQIKALKGRTLAGAS
jgi:hypothetical protein